MTLRSAVDDLKATTLAAFPGVLARLKYLAGLRQGDGGYAHWGLTRVYGETAAQKALADTHSVLIAEILRAPLRKLMEDAEICCSAEKEQPSVYLQDLLEKCSRLLPRDVGVGSTRHFSSVLRALSALTRNQPHATHPAA